MRRSLAKPYGTRPDPSRHSLTRCELEPRLQGHGRRNLLDRTVGAAVDVFVRAQRLRMADRADFGDVARERQADGPVDCGPDLADPARDLAQVVGPRHPPRGKATELQAAELAHRLVAAQVHERGLGLV